ncbi:unnamed protein product [Anisakis simplex]|uniref:protein-serine/threonine phosphatase n=1 Tax=Anisakis simplex TaxID=6269 RepID=A0A0M3JUW4_ANISI|nr:unnamed protein product [Anisakis simplex]
MGEFRLNESPVLTSHGFRRLDGKNVRNNRAMQGLALSPTTSSTSPHLIPRLTNNNASNNSNSSKAFDNWHPRINDSSIVNYYWKTPKPIASNQQSMTTQKATDSSTSRPSTINSSSRNTYFSNGTITGAHPKVAPTGYAPNRFPLSVSYNSDLSTETFSSSVYPSSNASTSASISSERISSSHSKPANTSASPIYSSLPSNACTITASKAASPYKKNTDSNNNSNIYFGTSSSRNVVDEIVGGYENVPSNSYSSRAYQNRLATQRQIPLQGLTDNIAPKLNTISYFTPSSVNANDKKATTPSPITTKSNTFDRCVHPVWTVQNKQQVSGAAKPTLTVRNGSSSRSSDSRSKPRMPKFFHTLCCCVRPETTANREKRRSLQQGSTLPNASSLITQVKKNSVNNAANANGNTAANDSYTIDDSDAAESMPMQPAEKLLLPPLRACDSSKKCLIIDLDETLVHSSFKPVKNADFVIPVEIDNVIHQVYVLKRPFVDEFLDKIGDKFECVLFTASLAKYADPVADLLDKRGVFRSRLFREACVFHKGNYVKDLTRLGRDLKKVIIVDNSPASYAFHPDNAIPVQSWFDDVNDSELLQIIPLLEQLANAESIYSILRNSNEDIRRSSSPETQNDASRSSSS